MPAGAASMVRPMTPPFTWRPTRGLYDTFRDAPDTDQCGLLNGQPIGSVEIDRGGPNRGRWYWTMWRDAPSVEMWRIQNKGLVSTEAEAKGPSSRPTTNCFAWRGTPAGQRGP
jgi:hypothetical protein